MKVDENKSDQSNDIISECSDYPDDEAAKEFQNAFGFASQQVHEKNVDDDLVDKKLKKMFNEFMIKQKRIFRVAHKNRALEMKKQTDNDFFGDPDEE